MNINHCFQNSSTYNSNDVKLLSIHIDTIIYSHCLIDDQSKQNVAFILQYSIKNVVIPTIK